jgi:plastocyanin
MGKPFATLIALLAATALIAAGCGGSDNNSSDNSSNSSSGTQGNTSDTTSTGGGGGGAASSLKLTADPGGALKFNTTTLSAKAGKVTVTMDNASQTPHAVEIEGNGVQKETETVTGADAPPITVDLKAGTYTYFCPVDGHEAAGMKGTLTVQ